VPLSFDINSIDAEEVIRRVIEEARKSEEVITLVLTYDVDVVTAGAILCRALRSLDTRYEIRPVYEAELIDSNLIINISNKVIDRSGCVNIGSSDRDLALRHGLSYVIKYRNIAHSLRRILSEFTVLPKEINYLVYASVLSRHTPRILDMGLSDYEKEILDEGIESGLISKVAGPKLINWGLVPLSDAVNKSFDILLPNYFLSNEAPRINDEDECVKLIATELNAEPERVRGNNYVTRRVWVVNDLYYLSYVLMYSVDVLGTDAAPIISNNNALTLATRKFQRSLRVIKEVINLGRPTKVKCPLLGGNAAILSRVNPKELSLTVLTKVLRGINYLGSDDVVIALDSKNAYVPLQVINETYRSKIFEVASSVIGGYAVVSRESLGV